MKSRSELREIIIKVLYQTYILDSVNTSYQIEDLIKEQLSTENEYITKTIQGIKENEKKLISKINSYLKDWTIDRVSKVDKSILLLGTYELLYTAVPKVVCINEAIELSKKYSDEKVTKMINATLDSIYHNECNEE